MEEPRWLRRSEVEALHGELVREYGGSMGVRDDDLVEAALARPLNLWHYGEPDLADLAAAYGFGIVQNHGYVDGNKRTALACMDVFLLLNGQEIVASEDEARRVIEETARGDRTEEQLARWVGEVVEASDFTTPPPRPGDAEGETG